MILETKNIYTDSGFTQMELLVTIAVVLVFAGALANAAAVSLRGYEKTNNAILTAVTLNKIDRTVRQFADGLIVPYWENPAPYIQNMTVSLYAAGFSDGIKSATVIYGSDGKPRGIEVEYAVNNSECKTFALFPFECLTGGIR